MTSLPDPPLARPARILIVDDEPFNVDYLEQELQSQGFLTETAVNGLEALGRVATAPPDLVLLDVMMPELDGIAALRMLKSDPETRLIPVVLMTALNAIEDRVRGIEAGADDFLTKPVDDRELLARIRTALSVKRTIDETVDELRSTSTYLEQYGRQQRDVAILAVAWRPRDPTLPAETAAFLGRRYRKIGEEAIRTFGGIPSETDASLLLAVFDGPDKRTRSFAAVDAALAVLAYGSHERSGGPTEPRVAAAIDVGPATVGSARIEEAAASRWVFGATGEPVETATRLAGEAESGVILASRDAAAILSSTFNVEPTGDLAYRIGAPARAGDEYDAAHPEAERSIRTMLITDVVGSTSIVERIGDRAWGELLGAQLRAIRSELVRFGGEELDTAGDGFIAAFESPTRAIRCALAVVRRSTDLGLTVRAGMHTGEVEQVEGRARGITVHLASRIAHLADPGELLVSATTRELAAGSGLVFVERGEHALKGLRQPRQLFAVVETAPDQTVLGPPPPRTDTSQRTYPAGLTRREVEVLRLVAVGLSDAETAERLFLSVRTVNAHLRSIYRKLGIRSRAAAGRYAEENDLL
jgi:DNA-binding NarL/FixJ family response regulator